MESWKNQTNNSTGHTDVTSCLKARPGTMPCHSTNLQPRSTTPNPSIRTSSLYTQPDTMSTPYTSSKRSSSAGRMGYSSVNSQSNLRHLTELSRPHPFTSKSHSPDLDEYSTLSTSHLHRHPSAGFVGQNPLSIPHGHRQPTPSAGFVGQYPPSILHGQIFPTPSVGFVGQYPPSILHGHRQPTPSAVLYPPSPVSVSWASGGLIIIQENYYNKKRNKNGPAVFLGFVRSKGLYELFYGKSDPGDRSPAYTACREAREESSNLFNFDHKRITDYVIKKNKYGPRDHYAFVVRVQSDPGISSVAFANNQTKLKSLSHVPHTWLEMDSITRVFMEDIEMAIAAGYVSGDMIIKDVNNNPITIKDRDAEFLKLAITSGLYETSYIHDVNQVNDKTMANTKSYILK